MTVLLALFSVWLVGGLALAVRRRGLVAAVEAFLPDLILAAAVLAVGLWTALVP